MRQGDAVLFDGDGTRIEALPVETQSGATRDAFRAVGAGEPDRRHVDALITA
ncbi:hypothetical protein [Natronococcus roseus]|uniref:hypothetical protein n=1 Tax=Natronococcus roseus TaxID=1052014 RepID=UPI00374D2B74